jgi:YD repeat-containing protein
MTRNRQVLRLLHLARPSKRNTTRAEPPQSRRRAFRRLGLATALTLLALCGAQVVLAVPPSGDFTISDDVPQVGQTVTFTSTGVSDPDRNDPVTVTWNFGDGQSDSGNSVSHAYSDPGEKTVTMTLTDSANETTTVPHTLRVNAPPSASFVFATAGEGQGAVADVGQTVNFNGSGSSDSDGTITRYEWDLDGNGSFETNSDGPTVSRSYQSPGTVNVKLRVVDSDGATSGVVIRDVVVNVPPTVTVNAPPQAVFIVTPENAFVGDTVTLSSISSDPDDRLMGQEWDLDNDGQFDDASAPVVSARFDSPGTYPLKLRVTDSRGASSTATGRVIVQSRPVPPLQVLAGVEVEARFLLFARDTKVKFLRVRAPAGSKVSVRCRGKKNCPKRLTKMSKGPKKLQFKQLQRMFRPRTKLIITVTKGGFIGKKTTYTMRRRKPPMKRTLCLPPGAKKANSCPSG